jgi:hypothetical protein
MLKLTVKFKLILILIFVFSLAGCSASGQVAAKDQIILGCDDFNRTYESNDYKISDAAKKYFAEAAKLDAGYLPLAQAAQTLTIDWNAEIIGVDFKTERYKALALVNGVCTE